jgi:hypothetical protein
VVAVVLAEEVRRGRVVHENGGYRIVEERFPADVLAALIRLALPDPDHSGAARPGRPTARTLARSFA